jgi:spectinomycin phosphotransferase
VNTPPPAGIDGRKLARALSGFWGLDVARLRYLPKGLGSFHWLAEARDDRRFFLTVDDLETKPWLGADADSTFLGLQAAYGTALALRVHGRLDFVVPPVPSLDDRVVVRLSPRHSLTVFEFVEGQPGQWGKPMPAGDRHRLVDTLAKLHRSTPLVRTDAPRRPLEVPGRAGLEAALLAVGRPWDGGPFSEMARRDLAENADLVRQWLVLFDDLAARVGTRAGPPVVTHGEPHPGNLIRVGGAFRLIDWDTVGISLPERDLWMLDDGPGGTLATYGQATGRAVDGQALDLYRLAWRLTDITLFTALLRSDHDHNQGTEKASKGLTDSLHCCEIPPYGR